LVDAVEVDGTLLGGLELPLAGVHPNRAARDQVVLDGDLEDLPEAGDRLDSADSDASSTLPRR
jgi:hypothetical protein